MVGTLQRCKKIPCTKSTFQVRRREEMEKAVILQSCEHLTIRLTKISILLDFSKRFNIGAQFLNDVVSTKVSTRSAKLI